MKRQQINCRQVLHRPIEPASANRRETTQSRCSHPYLSTYVLLRIYQRLVINAPMFYITNNNQERIIIYAKRVMKLNLKSAQFARAKATYRIVFGHSIPCAAYQTHEPPELAILLDKAIRDMKPLGEFKPDELIYPRKGARPKPLPLSTRALVRWQYMQRR